MIINIKICDLLALGCIRYLGKVKNSMKKRYSRYFSYIFLTIWRVGVFLLSMVIIEYYVTGEMLLFTLFYSGLGQHDNQVTEVDTLPSMERGNPVQARTPVRGENESWLVQSWPNAAVYTFLVQSFASFSCYLAAKFASKIRIQVRRVSITLVQTYGGIYNVKIIEDFYREIS